MGEARITSGITDVDVDCAALRAAVTDDRAGAIVTFEGAVRNHDHGKAVTGIEYVGHPSAAEIMGRIVADLAAREGIVLDWKRHVVTGLPVTLMSLAVVRLLA